MWSFMQLSPLSPKVRRELDRKKKSIKGDQQSPKASNPVSAAPSRSLNINKASKLKALGLTFFQKISKEDIPRNTY